MKTRLAPFHAYAAYCRRLPLVPALSRDKTTPPHVVPAQPRRPQLAPVRPVPRLFNSRFYYPVLAILFLDLGFSPAQYTVLNFAWAVAIVLTDVPAGVLADRIGRKPLVVARPSAWWARCAADPRAAGWRLVLFLFCLANRVLSGVAEGMASGADEALVFDSLAERNRSDEWPQVLDQVMRWQSVGMVIAMLVGGASYDPIFMNAAVSRRRCCGPSDQGMTLRFPIYLNLAMALVASWWCWAFANPAHQASRGPRRAGRAGDGDLSAWGLLLSAATGSCDAGGAFRFGWRLLLDSVVALIPDVFQLLFSSDLICRKPALA